MDLDQMVTDAAGLTIVAMGLVSLSESLLQVSIVGGRLPFVQGALISLFTASFGAVLLTESASKAFKAFRLKCRGFVS